MSFRDLQHETILEVMQQNNDKVSKEMKKGILNKIHQYDADKVLSFVIEVTTTKTESKIRNLLAQIRSYTRITIFKIQID